MSQSLRKGTSMDSTGYLGNSRVVLNHFDVSTQADIQHTALTYESEDEAMGRLHPRGRRSTPLYSKQDIREQYCISDRGLGALETSADRRGLFSCLSTRHDPSPCSARTNILTVCVRQKVSSDENLQDLLKRYPVEFAYNRRTRYPWAVPPPEIYPYDEGLECSYFRRKPRVDPRRYTWMPADDESVRLEGPRSVLDHCGANANLPPPPPPAVPRPKHVSFARSHTLTSFDDAAVSLGSSSSHLSKMSRSQERLIPVLGPRQKPGEFIPITRQPGPTENVSVILEKLKRSPVPMKTQATQTEACLGRRPLPPGKISLSPRTIRRVKMVSQGAQTNGVLNGRKLMKSFSEAYGRFGADTLQDEGDVMHEPLQRTQSDEPPRSPFILKSPPTECVRHESSTSSQSEDEDIEDDTRSPVQNQKEIIIDFEPHMQFSPVAISTKKRLIKTMSDGEILIDQRRRDEKEDSKHVASISHENIQIETEPKSFTPYFQNSPIKNEGIFRRLLESTYSSSFDDGGIRPQDSIDEEFHENLIYGGRYLRRSGSSTSDDLLENEGRRASPADEGVVPTLADRKLSPFASNDSLTNDVRDHSDGIWNESQVTVLQVDSGTDNGTVLSGSEINSLTTPTLGSALLLTPSSRRKHLLLLQHQQRSSIDTEALDEELMEQSKVQTPTSPKNVLDVPSISLSRPESLNQQYLSPRTAPSPSRRRKPQLDTNSAESPLPAVVPDLLLARTDSGKTNTDISESTTTTDDYITANSGTDSSRRDLAERLQPLAIVKEPIVTVDSSSTKDRSINDSTADMVVPVVCEKTLPGESQKRRPTPSPGRSSPSGGSSSSSGSYSIEDLDLPTQPPAVPSHRHVPSISEDERSIHYSSGYYESPAEDEKTWKPSRSEKQEWTEDEKKRRKKTFTLDIEESPRAKHKTILKSARKQEDVAKDSLKTTEKPKRSKVRTRSPLQMQKKKISPSSSRLPVLEDARYNQKGKNGKHAATSDESSSGICESQLKSDQVSPRRGKKFKENNRRKSIPRSPTGSRGRKRSDSMEDKPSSLPGSLPRRRSMQVEVEEGSKKSKLSPYSPAESPSKKRRSPESSRLKALSAESLRSVSPGSDSVFYSDPSSHAALPDHQVHCLHCGKEVDIVTTDDLEKNTSTSGGVQQADIVQPPAGFADSPRIKYGRLYKKLEKRFRSEERSQGERKHHRYRHDVRAKSEERGGKAEGCRVKLRPMARSTDTSLEGLRAADSSPSVLPGAPEDEDDLGVYNVPYTEGCWVYIDDHDELNAWQRRETTEDEAAKRDPIDDDSTDSEHEFLKKYQAITHRMVHRRSCLEMYKRQASKSFAPESTTGEHESLRRSLEELLKLMLIIWCKENCAIKLITSTSNESDKTVMLQRDSGEFGFRIHGSKPVVVSAIEPDTPAESSGLEVGDIVLAVNGVSVLDKNHSEVVKIAHAGSDTLTLEVARTCGVLSPTSADAHGGEPLYSGYVWKLGGYASGTPSSKWVRRWFSLKKDNCLYYYRTDSDKQPVGAMMLLGYDICKVDNASSGVPAKPFRFDLKRPGVPTLHLAADTEAAVSRWIQVLAAAAQKSQIADTWLEQTRRNLTLAPDVLPKPDCFGYLVKLGNQWKSWSRRYCVLKDACLYFYQDVNAKSAFGVACLHGYRVQQSNAGTKKHAFEIVPSDPTQKHFYFYTESDVDRKRWVAALEYSIDRWLKVG